MKVAFKAIIFSNNNPAKNANFKILAGLFVIICYAHAEKYKPKNGYTVSLNFESKKKIDECKVVFTTLLKLMAYLKNV